MSQKLITFCVPSYNSEAYLHVALDSLIPGGDEIEVLVIDDGSQDKTLEIAQDYEKRYPNIFKAIHEENRGHGGAINNALSHATGIYFKVVDSDDWVDENGLKVLLSTIKKYKSEPDMILMPYVYRHQDDSTKDRVISYKKFIPADRLITWNEVKRFDVSTNLVLHSVYYKTSVLKEEMKIKLPEHCFYEDNYFIYAPLSHIKKLLYVDTPCYQYLLGRTGQSMQTQNLIKRNHDLMRVALLSFKEVDIVPYKKQNKHLYNMMKHQLDMILEAPLLYTSYKEKKVANKEKKEFVEELKKINLRQFNHLRHHSLIICFSSQANGFGILSSKFMLSVVRRFGAVN